MTTIVLNLTRPGQDPVDGDMMEYRYPNGSIERKTYYTPSPVVPEVLPPDPCEYLIDIGPFFDRFGAAKMAVLVSTDATVRAILSDVQVRKWIDLTRSDVAQSLAYIASKVPSLTPAIQTAILTDPVTPAENMALRKLFF